MPLYSIQLSLYNDSADFEVLTKLSYNKDTKLMSVAMYIAIYIIIIEGMFDGEKFGEFGESLINHQLKTIQISTDIQQPLMIYVFIHQIILSSTLKE